MADDRRLWRALEAIHAVVYFAPEAATVYEEIGLRGWWAGYVASRSAALGPVGPAPVVALFHGFAPGRIARILPAAWEVAPPPTAIEARHRLASLVLQRAGVDPDGLAATADLVAQAPYAGRALAAAHAALPRPDDPLLALWHDATALRELRGDGHVAALVCAGLDGCAANVLMRALELVPARMQAVRGWSDEEWAAATDALRGRGLLDADGAPTGRGRTLREEVERATDATVAFAAPPAGLVDGLVAQARRIAAAGAVPYPNPVGVPAP